MTTRDPYVATRQELREFLSSASSVALFSGGPASARTIVATEVIETAVRWLRVAAPSREHAHLALDLHADGVIFLDKIDRAHVFEVIERTIREAQEGSTRRVIISGSFDESSIDCPVTRVRLSL
ncbi:hypothetical protein [uncultured Microbacterium sp.]|uniref:hypothetical protein n=1 Tax=uncultured Microbacterium sp. TaxID=191216 RepID=UPI0025E1AF45|nr:hypothetical protein [uncultured Microbacterium sp.]